MSQGPLCPNLTKKGQAEVSQMANRNLSRVILLGGLSVNLNHLIIGHFLAKNHLCKHNVSLHCIRQEIDPKGNNNIQILSICLYTLDLEPKSSRSLRTLLQCDVLFTDNRLNIQNISVLYSDFLRKALLIEKLQSFSMNDNWDRK